MMAFCIAFGIFLLVGHFLIWRMLMDVCLNRRLRKWYWWTCVVPFLPFLIILVHIVGWIYLDLRKK